MSSRGLRDSNFAGSTTRRADCALIDELRRLARGEAYDEQPMPGLASVRMSSLSLVMCCSPSPQTMDLFQQMHPPFIRRSPPLVAFRVVRTRARRDNGSLLPRGSLGELSSAVWLTVKGVNWPDGGK